MASSPATTTVRDTVKRSFNAIQFMRSSTVSDLPLSHMAVLCYVGLQAGGDIGKTQLESVLDMSTSTMSRILQRLGAGSSETDRVKGLGLVSLAEDPADWRYKRVSLTKRGREVLDTFARIVCPEVAV